jgi:hypothetical protein
MIEINTIDYLMYCVEKKTLNAKPLRKSLEDRSPVAYGRQWQDNNCIDSVSGGYKTTTYQPQDVGQNRFYPIGKETFISV